MLFIIGIRTPTVTKFQDPQHPSISFIHLFNFGLGLPTVGHHKVTTSMTSTTVRSRSNSLNFISIHLIVFLKY